MKNLTGKKIKTRHIGVYRYMGEDDTCFYITYKVGPKLVWERVGWEKAGVSCADAVELRADRVKSMRHNSAVCITKLTLDQGFQKFIKYQSADGRDITADLSRYSVHIKPYFGHIQMGDITPLMIQECKPKWLHLSDSSKYQILGLLSKVYNRLSDLKVFHGPNPVKGIGRKVPDNGRKRFLTKEEAQALLSTLKEIDVTAYQQVALSLLTGLRKVEVMRLKGRDIDLLNKTLVVIGKGGKERYVELSDQAVTTLYNIPMMPNEYLFKEFKDAAIRKAMEPLNEGVESVTWSVSYHTLRHTFASWLAQEGVPLNTIKELMGHSTIQMTERYAKLMPKNRESAVNLIRL